MRRLKIYLIIFLFVPIVAGIENGKNKTTEYKNIKPMSSSTETLQFGEIYPNCNDGRLEGQINETVNENITLTKINVTFSAVSLWPPGPEANNFTVIVELSDTVIFNESIQATEHSNYSVASDISVNVVAGQLIEVNVTCPDGSAQSLFLGYKNDEPSIRSNIKYKYTEQPEPDPDLYGPNITILSPKNITYNTEINLTFSTNETLSWVGYKMDGSGTKEIANNTLLNVTEGTHRLQVFGNDTANNQGSDEVWFSVDIGDNDDDNGDGDGNGFVDGEDPFPWIWIILGITAIGATVTAIIMIKKRKISNN